MFALDLSLNPSRTGVSLPGTAGATTWTQVTGPSGTKIVRRVSATSNTIPDTLTISHEMTGGSGFKQRCRTMIRNDVKFLNTDLSITGGVVPSLAVYLVIDRPINSGGAVSTTVIKNAIAMLTDLLTQAGHIEKLLNQEA